MGIFDMLGKQGASRASQPQQMNPRQAQQAAMQQEISRISANPGAYLKEKGFTVPDGMTDARQITEHLLRTNQISNPRYQMVMRMLNGGTMR